MVLFYILGTEGEIHEQNLDAIFLRDSIALAQRLFCPVAIDESPLRADLCATRRIGQ